MIIITNNPQPYHPFLTNTKHMFCSWDGLWCGCLKLWLDFVLGIITRVQTHESEKIQLNRIQISERYKIFSFWRLNLVLAGFLNRQIVTLLSTLDVPDDVFWEMQQCMIFETWWDGWHPISQQRQSFSKGCQAYKEQLQHRQYPRKVSTYRCLLEGSPSTQKGDGQGQCFIQVSTPSLENCIVNHGSRFSETKKNLEVIKGFVVVLFLFLFGFHSLLIVVDELFMLFSNVNV